MGAVRFLLALSVIIHHGDRFGPPLLRLIAADMAVYLFFIISGFYMAMTLERNYLGRPDGVWRFYLNRIARLYPLYALCLVVSVALFYADRQFFARIEPSLVPFPAILQPQAGALGFRAICDFANVFVFGSDWLRSAGTIFGTRLEINPPAWSLATEACFYAMAPALVILARRPWTVAALAVAFAALPPGAVFYFSWQTTIIGCASFFLVGILTYRMGERAQRKRPEAVRRIGRVVFAGAAAAIGVPVLWLGYLPPFYAPADIMGNAIMIDPLSPAWIPFYIAFAAALPPLFEATRRSAFDKFLGDLSYPLYVSHWPVNDFIVPAINHYGESHGFAIPFALQGWAVIAAAVVLRLAVDWPMERVRNRIHEPPKRKPPLPGIDPVMTNLLARWRNCLLHDRPL